MANKDMTIKLIVDKSRNQVVFAESGKDFVDVLLSFLTLPIGTIIRLSDKQSSMHSFDNIYKSAGSLGADCFITEASQLMLLRPFNSAEKKCKCLRIHIGDIGAPRYFICPSRCSAELLSVFRNTRCDCGKVMDMEVNLLPTSDPCDEIIFVKGVRGLMRFTITDDMVISLLTTEDLLSLFSQLGVENKSSLEEREVRVGRSEVLYLLKRSLCSRTALTDVFLERKEVSPMQSVRVQLPQTADTSSSQFKKISVKLVLNKCDKKLLYAESKQDFVDLLFSFLTYPSGSLVKLLGGQSCMVCIDNLYKSVECLSSACCLNDGDSKEKLLNPKLPLHFSINNQLARIEEEAPERFYMCRTDDCDFKHLSTIPNVRCGCNRSTNKRLKLVDPKVVPKDYESTGGFLRNATYLVDDDLVVTPLSTASVLLAHLKGAKEGVEVVTVDIGDDEALALLQASITSKTPLTDALVKSSEEKVLK